MFNNYLKVMATKNGKGVFSTADIDANTPIAEITGVIYTEETLPIPNDPNVLQIGNNVYLGSSGGASDFLNHSCNPNCFLHVVGNRAFIFSMYLIKAGTELTVDYATTSTDTKDKWSMNCNCGDYNCRKVISGYNYLDDATKQKYIEKKAVPLFITNPGLFLKKY